MKLDVLPPLPDDALFQVGDQQPVPLAHLERVNPELAAEDKLVLQALAVGKSARFTFEGRTASVRRTR